MGRMQKKIRWFSAGESQKGFSLGWDCHLGLKVLRVAGRAFRGRRRREGMGIDRRQGGSLRRWEIRILGARSQGFGARLSG